jgi:hypothetical protein
VLLDASTVREEEIRDDTGIDSRNIRILVKWRGIFWDFYWSWLEMDSTFQFPLIFLQKYPESIYFSILNFLTISSSFRPNRL